MTSGPGFGFTLHEERAKNGYAVQAGAARLAYSVSFDSEETDDPKTAISAFCLGSAPGTDRRRFDRTVPEVAVPTAPHDDDETTLVEFWVPAP